MVQQINTMIVVAPLISVQPEFLSCFCLFPSPHVKDGQWPQRADIGAVR